MNAVFAGIRLEVVFGSILNLEGQVECIVNAANSRLQYCGGLAGSLAELAGPALEKESQDYIRKNKRLSTGTPIFTTAGNLRFKKILHVVGPVIENQRPVTRRDKFDLEDTVFSSIIFADKNGLSSIGIPAISCGVFKFPKKEGAESHVQAFKKFALDKRATSIRKVIFALYAEDEANCFIDAVMDIINEFQYVQITELPRKQANSNLIYCGMCSQLIEQRLFNIHVPCNEYCNFCVYRYKIAYCYKCRHDMNQKFNEFIYCRKCKDRKRLNAESKSEHCKICNNMCESHYRSGGTCEYCENKL